MRGVHFEIVPPGILPLAALSNVEDRLSLNEDILSHNDWTAIAHKDGRILGLLVGSEDNYPTRWRRLRLFICWVHPRWRRRGLAKLLGRLLIAEARAEMRRQHARLGTVSACVISRGGHRFMRWLAREHRSVRVLTAVYDRQNWT